MRPEHQGRRLRFFVQENQGCERMRPYLSAIESLVRDMDAMAVSARTQQTDMHDFFLPARAAANASPAAGAEANLSAAFQLCAEYSGLTLFSGLMTTIFEATKPSGRL